MIALKISDFASSVQDGFQKGCQLLGLIISESIFSELLLYSVG